MPKTRITDETMRAIRGEAIYGFHKTGIRQADGTWLVEFDDEVAARLEEIALPGERVDDTIQRVIRQHRGDRPTDGGSARLPPPDQGRRFSFGGRTAAPITRGVYFERHPSGSRATANSARIAGPMLLGSACPLWGTWIEVGEVRMTEGVYRIVDVVGVSDKSWEDAGRKAVETAASSLRDLRVAEVTKLDMKVENGKVAAFRTRVSLSFKYEA